MIPRLHARWQQEHTHFRTHPRDGGGGMQDTVAAPFPGSPLSPLAGFPRLPAVVSVRCSSVIHVISRRLASVHLVARSLPRSTLPCILSTDTLL